MEEQINALLADTPEGLQPLTGMNIPNESLIVYEGHYNLVSNRTMDIRNAFVHGQEEKRKKLQAIPGVVIVEVLHLGILYVELVLLKLLEYKGPCFNRCIEVTYKA